MFSCRDVKHHLFTTAWILLAHDIFNLMVSSNSSHWDFPKRRWINRFQCGDSSVWEAWLFNQDVEKAKLRRSGRAEEKCEADVCSNMSSVPVGRFPDCRQLLALFFHAHPPALWPLVNILCWVLPFSTQWCHPSSASTCKQLLSHVSFSKEWSRWGHWAK